MDHRHVVVCKNCSFRNDFHANYVPSSFSPPNDDHHGGCFNGCGWLKRWLFNNIHPFQLTTETN
ncbi:hypothetical protein DERP_009742 [Dermatophagoides pteronyssinus]|uniref:Uncharacterized protein n=1 Tax=Dermatophagoides pteronyssinus TaxID=6956 RepID=A0ABQ8IR10_DERPT|nr:hypothetical protein DERP_009742 [Dermatophagoides pteronyssinus]